MSEIIHCKVKIGLWALTRNNTKFNLNTLDLQNQSYAGLLFGICLLDQFGFSGKWKRTSLHDDGLGAMALCA